MYSLNIEGDFTKNLCSDFVRVVCFPRVFEPS